ncbi:hypothetical protein BJ322DRAFT_1217819 [Thelephora terrestris]|uniref:Uncharacterized protein n=1 Tax=Thelephora terrestris TaxID=56493 RepID=A0A9P6HHD7_9AGAM|nr:hypothetical protein BJ322DRAFT_1217819 [Thelephora terrestris]
MPWYRGSKPSFQPSLTFAFVFPTLIAAGPLGIGVEFNLDAGPEGALRSWITPPGSIGGRGSRVVIRDIVSRLPETSGVSTATPGFEVTITKHEREVPLDAPNEQPGLTAADLSSVVERAPGVRNEGETHTGKDAQGNVQSRRSRVAGRDRKDRAVEGDGIAFEIAKGTAEVFGILKAALATISVVYAEYQETVAVKDKVGTLVSRVAALQAVFEKPADDKAEERRRDELKTKMETIEKTWRSLHPKSPGLRVTDYIHNREDVFGLLEDLREAIDDYQMVQQMEIYEQGCKLIVGTNSTLDNKSLTLDSYS